VLVVILKLKKDIKMDIDFSHQAALTTITTPQRMTLQQAIAGWLAEKEGKSASKKTKTAYQEGLDDFQEVLQQVGLSLDSAPALVAPILQGWAASSKREGEEIAPATYNQRKAIISSFYQYAIIHEVLMVNPAKRVQPRTISKKNAARPIAVSTVKEGLAHINRKTLEGKRDYALLSLALATGRRVSELAGLRIGHLQKQGRTAEIFWARCKGNKQRTDVLQEKTTAALYDYLSSLYGPQMGTQPKDAPIWISFSDRNKGQALSTRTLQRICEAHLGTSKMHATRHTHAVTMHHSGATLAEIGKSLGHNNLKTTSDYLDELLGNENQYSTTLETIFGI
jgi:site-specific recombinase XerD